MIQSKLFICSAVGIFLLSNAGCAVLHKVSVGQIDGRPGPVAVPFEVMVSETGISVEEAGAIARGLSRTQEGRDAAGGIAGINGLFQMGPRTGNPVYNESYAKRVVYLIHEKCPTGRVTGLMSIREMRKYPVISGEIVKITGYCLRNRQPANENEKNSPADSLEGEV